MKMDRDCRLSCRERQNRTTKQLDIGDLHHRVPRIFGRVDREGRTGIMQVGRAPVADQLPSDQVRTRPACGFAQDSHKWTFRWPVIGKKQRGDVDFML